MKKDWPKVYYNHIREGDTKPEVRHLYFRFDQGVDNSGMIRGDVLLDILLYWQMLIYKCTAQYNIRVG